MPNSHHSSQVFCYIATSVSPADIPRAQHRKHLMQNLNSRPITYFSTRATIAILASSAGLAFAAAPSILNIGGENHLRIAGTVIQSTSENISRPIFTQLPEHSAAISWQQSSLTGTSSFYAFSSDGTHWSRPIPGDPSILNLRWANFDPLILPSAPTIPAHLRALPTSTTFIIQFVVPPIDSMRRAVEDLGAIVHTSLPQSAYIVNIDPAQLPALRALPAVRWVGAYEPAFKTEPSIARGYLSQFGAADPAARADFERNWGKPYIKAMESLRSGGSASFWIQVHQADILQKQIVADHITAIGGKVQNITPQDFLLRAELNQAQFVSVLQLDQVAFVDPWSDAEFDMDIERNLSGANALEAATGISGEGVRGEVMDNGLRQTHQDFSNPGPAVIVRFNSGDISHGTSTFGIVFGDGGANAAARGLLPDAAAKYFYSYTGLSGFGGTANRLTVTSAAVTTNNIVFQSNSWGSALTTAYGTQSNAMDNIIFQTNLSICQSQSNTGSQQSRPEAWAKNVLSVGGLTHNNDTNRANDTWGGGSSIGPAADLRIKPELAHHYDNVLATTSTSDTAYTAFGGTSAATPITCGYIGLIHQMWHQGMFPGFGGASDVFASRPYFTTAKALAIHSAFRYNWTGTPSNPTINRNVQGWGVIDVNRLRLLAPTMFVENESKSLRAGQSAFYTFDVPAGAPSFTATMLFRDPPGTTSSSIHRINDASLKVTGPTGTFWWGNNGLSAGNVSTSGGVSNTCDTVENVFLVNPPAGRYTVQVFADIVTQDGNPRSVGVNDITYALAVSGGLRTPLRILTLDTARAGTCADTTSRSFASGPAFELIRTWLADPTRFGGAGKLDRPVTVLPPVSSLSAASLADADVVVLTGVVDSLSACERGRLSSFLQQGGGVLAFFDTAGNELAEIVGAQPGGISNSASLTPAGASGTVLAGLFGNVDSPVLTGAHRVFTDIGPNGTPLLVDNGQNTAAIFVAGAGRAIILNDEDWASNLTSADCLQGQLPAQSNERFFLNSLAAVAPVQPISFTFSSCPADFNCDSLLDLSDYLDFVQAFSNDSPVADFNQDSSVDFFDYLDFVQTFSAGC